MRETKFRAFINGKFYYFTLYALAQKNPLFTIREIVKPWLLIEGNEPDAGTCLIDSKGKEIYEGDMVAGYEILSSTPAGDDTIYHPCKVVYSETHGAFMFEESEETAFWYQGLDETEVIGNIYENPELLEDK